MSNLILSLFLITTVLTASAQVGHDLTVFSADGLRFTLTLNGWQVNDEPQSQVIAGDIMNDYVKAVVRFENESIEPIVRNILQLKSVNSGGWPEAVVYELVEKKGKQVLRWRSATRKHVQPVQTVIIREEVPPPAPGIEINAPGVNVRVTPPH